MAKRKTLNNRGAELLRDLSTREGSLRAVAIRAGENEGQLCHYLHCDRKPRLDTRLRLRKSLGIPLFAWDEIVKGSHGKNQK